MRADRSSRRRGRSPGRGARCLRDPQLDPSVPRGGGEGVRDVPAQARPRNQGCVPTCRMTVARQTAEATPFRARLALTGRAGQRELTVVDQCDPTPSGCAPRRLDTSRRRPHGVRRSPSTRAQRRPAQLRDARRNVDVADAPCVGVRRGYPRHPARDVHDVVVSVWRFDAADRPQPLATTTITSRLRCLHDIGRSRPHRDARRPSTTLRY